MVMIIRVAFRLTPSPAFYLGKLYVKMQIDRLKEDAYYHIKNPGLLASGCSLQPTANSRL